jgi:hypothetical protein
MLPLGSRGRFEILRRKGTEGTAMSNITSRTIKTTVTTTIGNSRQSVLLLQEFLPRSTITISNTLSNKCLRRPTITCKCRLLLRSRQPEVPEEMGLLLTVLPAVVDGFINLISPETTTRKGTWILFILVITVNKYCLTTRLSTETSKLKPLSTLL